MTTTRPLDRETLGSLLNVEVKAEEVPKADEVLTPALRDSSVLRTVVNMSILIDDVNDFPPTFSAKEFYTAIKENFPVGTALPHLDMVVSDQDTVND